MQTILSPTKISEYLSMLALKRDTEWVCFSNKKKYSVVLKNSKALKSFLEFSDTDLIKVTIGHNFIKCHENSVVMNIPVTLLFHSDTKTNRVTLSIDVQQWLLFLNKINKTKKFTIDCPSGFKYFTQLSSGKYHTQVDCSTRIPTVVFYSPKTRTTGPTI
jgi:hypothetical protein